jgi:dTDP-glucose 4,6-dehydratase
MDILVTGGAGFIGSNFVHHLLRETEHQIHVLDLLTYAGDYANLEPSFHIDRLSFKKGDIRDESTVKEMMSTADVLVNFAAESHVDRSIDTAEPFVTTNIGGTQTLLDMAVDTDIELFIQISTDEVYGEIEYGSFSEGARLGPRNPYAATKAGADLFAISYYQTYGLPVIITRTSNNFGPRQHREKLIPKLITRASRGDCLPIYGDGTNVREWTYVEDNCRGLDLVLNEGQVGEVYNIGSGVELTNIEVATKVVEAMDIDESLINFVEDRAGHDQRYSLNSNKIRELGWEPQWSFDEGLAETVQFYLN